MFRSSGNSVSVVPGKSLALIENASEQLIAPSAPCPEAFPIKANDYSATRTVRCRDNRNRWRLLGPCLPVTDQPLRRGISFRIPCISYTGMCLPQHWEAVEGAASYASPKKDTCACQSLCRRHRP